jgi:hypothetical protein
VKFICGQFANGNAADKGSLQKENANRQFAFILHAPRRNGKRKCGKLLDSIDPKLGHL